MYFLKHCQPYCRRSGKEHSKEEASSTQPFQKIIPNNKRSSYITLCMGRQESSILYKDNIFPACSKAGTFHQSGPWFRATWPWTPLFSRDRPMEMLWEERVGGGGIGPKGCVTLVHPHFWWITVWDGIRLCQIWRQGGELFRTGGCHEKADPHKKHIQCHGKWWKSCKVVLCHKSQWSKQDSFFCPDKGFWLFQEIHQSIKQSINQAIHQARKDSHTQGNQVQAHVVPPMLERVNHSHPTSYWATCREVEQPMLENLNQMQVMGNLHSHMTYYCLCPT